MGDSLICKQINMLCTIRKTTFPRKGRLIHGLLSCLSQQSLKYTALLPISTSGLSATVSPPYTVFPVSSVAHCQFLTCFLSPIFHLVFWFEGTNLKWKPFFPFSNLFQIPFTKSVYVARAFTLSPSSPSWLQGTELLLLCLLTGKVILGHEGWGQG